MERYTPQEAIAEAEKLQSIIRAGEASSYTDAESKLSQYSTEGEYLFNPRREYSEGRVPLAFECTLEDGAKLVAHEKDAEGKVETPKIQIIDKDGAVVFDFETLLPAGWIFRTPRTYIPKRKGNPDSPSLIGRMDTEPEPHNGVWASSSKNKEILIGDWREPQDLLPLLHELGHAHLPELSKESIASLSNTDGMNELVILEDGQARKLDSSDNPFAPEVVIRRRSLAKNPEIAKKIEASIILWAKSERDASAWALRTLRKVSSEISIDLMKTNGIDRKTLARSIKSALQSHKSLIAEELGIEVMHEDESEIIDSLVEQLSTSFKV